MIRLASKGRRMVVSMVLGGPLCLAVSCPAQGDRVIDRAEYESRCRAMWLGEAIGNWTGLPIENAYYNPPFLTDANWRMPLSGGRTLDFVFQDPWRSDDDTDIEYVYLHLLTQDPDAPLTPDRIVAGWTAHINHHIWNSNRNARTLMDQGIYPPATSLRACNILDTLISAQLTIEIFGALNPGMPDRALEMADMPIHTTAYGNAAHACQFYVVLYSLAMQTPPDLTPAEKVVWLVEQARRYIPDSSMTADAADFVLDDFLSNPNPDDWEHTRDRIYDRYQLHPQLHGFAYRGFSESLLNFANGMMCLLYGRGDYKRTIQIGTLAGWDCDNQPATMGGLLGLMLGYDQLLAQFPGQAMSDRYTWTITRDNLVDYLPSDPAAEDTFSMMAARMGTIAEHAVARAGGLVDEQHGRWLLPPPVPWADRTPAGAIAFNPSVREWLRSNNVAVLAQGGTTTATCSAPRSNPPFIYPYNYGLNIVSFIANGVEQDFSGVEADDWGRNFYSTQNSGQQAGDLVSFTVTYGRDVAVQTVRFIEGNHPNDDNASGGWMDWIHPELFVDGQWIDLPESTQLINPPDPARPYQYVDWVMPQTINASAVRVTGPVGGRDAFATVSELDTLGPPIARPFVPSFDLNSDGVIDEKDLLSLARNPVDLNGDGVLDDADRKYLQLAVRWAAYRAATGWHR